jgi:hypothetical protein
MDFAKTFVAGIVAIGMVTAFGLHATGLSKFAGAAGNASSKVLNTAEKG